MKAHWAVVRHHLDGRSVANYCGHAHLSYDAAHKCLERAARKQGWPRQYFRIIESWSGR